MGTHYLLRQLKVPEMSWFSFIWFLKLHEILQHV